MRNYNPGLIRRCLRLIYIYSILFFISYICIAYSPSEAATQPKSGGIFIIALSSNPPNLNPATTTSSVCHSVTSALFGALVKYDYDYQPQPDLAVSWKISEDGKRYTFRLAEGVFWHDGKPFTSRDVKYTFEEVLLKYHPMGTVAFEAIKSIETPDSQTVVFHLSSPFGPMMSVLGLFNAAILPEHIYKGTDILRNEANNKPIGNGPFKFLEWVKGDHITLLKNDKYHKAGLPYLDRIVFQIIPSAGNRVLALEKKDVDSVVSS